MHHGATNVNPAIPRSAAPVPPVLGILLLAVSAALGQAVSRESESPSPATNLFELIPGLKAIPAEEAKVPTLGAIDKESGYKLKVELSGWGASILNIYLSEYKQAIESPDRFIVNRALKDGGSGNWIYPFAARAVSVNGQWINLSRQWELLEPLDAGAFRTTLEPDSDATQQRIYNRAVYAMTLVDQDGQSVLEIRRTYTLDPDSYELQCNQELINRSDKTLQITWEQNAQGDIPNDDASYLGDRRMVVAGYYELSYDHQRVHVFTDDTYLSRLSVLDEHQEIVTQSPSRPLQAEPLWPNDNLPPKCELLWIASLNRYFAAAVYLSASAASDEKIYVVAPLAPLPLEQLPEEAVELPGPFDKLGIDVFGAKVNKQQDNRILVFTLTSKQVALTPGGQTSLDLSLFVGPRKVEVLESEPYAPLQLTELIRYSLGCTFFTFQWLAKALLAFLKLIHAVIFDWGIAIIILVIVVRLLLHPITKKAQVNMTKMGKQMQQLQPEMEKLKKKYKDDQKRLQKEMMQLYRERGVNAANVLGCLPMFLQMPIWIALYAMLYYAVELRHEAAFYGVFQAISGGSWHFLADLSSADHFIKFAKGFTLPLIIAKPTIHGINILPLLWGVAMFFQQKYMTPPPANEQAAQQQKIMKWMMLLFPIMLYPAPSGLTLYILASTGAGVLDSYLVRRHIQREEEAGTLFKPKSNKRSRFMDWISKAAEARKQQMEERTIALRGGQVGKIYKKRKPNK